MVIKIKYIYCTNRKLNPVNYMRDINKSWFHFQPSFVEMKIQTNKCVYGVLLTQSLLEDD